jgi:hypothetical protein
MLAGLDALTEEVAARHESMMDSTFGRTAGEINDSLEELREMPVDLIN